MFQLHGNQRRYCGCECVQHPGQRLRVWAVSRCGGRLHGNIRKTVPTHTFLCHFFFCYSVVCYQSFLNFVMLVFPVGLCVSECVSLRLCFSVPACECCMILFTYNLCRSMSDVRFFSHTASMSVCVCVCVCAGSSRMFNVCECCLCLCAFQNNTPGGRHDREGRRVPHGGPQPQRRPLMVPSIGQ